MDKKEMRQIIAKRVAKEFNNGDVINLGIGLPTYVANYIADDITVTLQSENGFIGMAAAAEAGREIKNLVNAGGQSVTVEQDAAFFDSATSFAIIRGGHVDCTVLGALQVDAKGNLANWMIPGKLVPGMGGAMDLVTGARRVIVAMEHTAKGKPKIFDQCQLPLTAAAVVDLIVTECAVFSVDASGLTLIEKHAEYTVEQIRQMTAADFAVGERLAAL